MSVPPLRLYNHFEPYISGEVNIHPSAVIAPGVILQAAPEGKIVIGPGACIGMGSILKVYEGTLIVGEGANIGSGFLMIGAGKIGDNTCIGSATTVFYDSVESGLVIAPGSVLGDNSRKIIVEEESTISASVHSEEVTQSQSSGDTQISNGKVESVDSVESETIQENLISQSNIFTSTKQYFKTRSEKNNSSNSGESVEDAANTNQVISSKDDNDAAKTDGTDTQQSQVNTHAEESKVDIGTHIYGRGNIERLLVTLFPHRQSLNNKSLNEESD